MIDENLITALISIAISLGVFFTIRIIFKIKLKDLQGTKKLLNLISIGIIISEIVYLGINFNLFEMASEIIASIGVAFALVAWALQNHLKNIVAGIGVYLNPEISIGDVIEVDEKKGTIIDLHLTKITALTDEGQRMFIPTQKIHDSVALIYHKQRKNV